MSVRMFWAVEVSPDPSALASESSAFAIGLEDSDVPLIAPTPPSGGLGGGFAAIKPLSDDTMLCASEVSPAERAVWSDFRKSLILSPAPELLLSLELEPELLEAAFGACESMSFKTLWAADVSPESKALVRESSAFAIGLESLAERFRAPARVVLVAS